MSPVTLGIQIEWVDSGKVLALISFPSEYAIVIRIEHKCSVFAKLNDCINLGTVTATKVIVAVYHVVIVRKTTAKQDGIQEDALFELRYIT